MKKKIYLVVGKSGSGKTTLCRLLEEKCGTPMIVSYTTRAMRDGERDGVEHWFVEECDVEKHDMAAYTVFGDKEYWTTWSQFEQYDKCTYIIDEDGIKFFEANLPDDKRDAFEIVKILIKRNNINKEVDEQRKNRDDNKFNNDDDCYDFVIENDDALESSVKKLNDIINNM